MPHGMSFPSSLVLHFPLGAIFHTTDTTDEAPVLKGVKVLDAFKLSQDNVILRRPYHDLLKARNRIQHFFQAIDSRHLQLHPWFQDCMISLPSSPASHDLTSFLHMVHIDNKSLAQVTTGAFRRHMAPPVKTTNLTPACWKSFWRQTIPHHCRNLCSAPVEDPIHFFFSCPPKSRVCNIMLARHAPEWNLQAANDILFLGKLPKRSDTSALLVVLVAVTAHAIWRAHWNFIFDESPFLAGVVAEKASSAVARNLAMRTPHIA
ncbi:hypothetical protein PHYBLDRAFT_147601 [Phycomyces blakesleeanus NRRL 1555(-)]|uniref:Reverse transcriptase zinc-binding domain-containing protein n=1 Tax=Phycomyces blakesleeanus (strain ATCC 8743b / DSM 1359 / FGSC 10004 / NBRC 33097 / NRRL 1555) TaxID=763407 RepID=A0A162TXQ0_PHYB8|nr:hypothetical protein PHYBLDRAFT_147601 [Phycomyces blakesleeanus NRRL 1555(-)]OAD71842.1 hypothetical protein PHYBLDRAFT_147601 [Phycomyces blakesleeanus NRRL 1555(-)]|eukprot:XP_018289882.1 hypothetical protein PHYBLDRAFT_147601 [Phycomyces blakesleeanus NRRL 1555(-)]